MNLVSKNKKSWPAYESISAWLRYDSMTGDIFWKKGRKTGMIATYSNKDGRRVIYFEGRHMMATHIIWMIMHGRYPLPGMVIDHWNGDCSNDCLENLREISRLEDAQSRGYNTKMRRWGLL